MGSEWWAVKTGDGEGAAAGAGPENCGVSRDRKKKGPPLRKAYPQGWGTRDPKEKTKSKTSRRVKAVRPVLGHKHTYLFGTDPGMRTDLISARDKFVRAIYRVRGSTAGPTLCIGNRNSRKELCYSYQCETNDRGLTSNTASRAGARIQAVLRLEGNLPCASQIAKSVRLPTRPQEYQIPLLLGQTSGRRPGWIYPGT